MYLDYNKVLLYDTPAQRSPEWFNLRAKYLTSSDLGTVLGKNKYKTAEELFEEKVGRVQREFVDNSAIRHGIKYESEAIDLYCRILGRTCHDIGLVPFDTFRDAYVDGMDCSFLAGSADGITMNTSKEDLNIIEVKCPLHRRIKYGTIPDYYYPQVQMNIHILNVRFGDYVEYVPTNVQGNIYPLMNIVRVYRDDEWLKSVYPVLRKFWDNVIQEKDTVSRLLDDI